MTNNRRHNNESTNELILEALENRQMLSTVELFVAGATNQEAVSLNIDGQSVQIWEGVGGDAYAGEFVKLTFQTEGTVQAGQIQVEFLNDAFGDGVDRNLRVDKIVVDGQTYETEDPSVFSTGTWTPETGVSPGNFQSEYLHANGYFQFASSNPGGGGEGQIDVIVRGSTGDEQFVVEVAGQEVGFFQAGTDFYTFSAQVSAEATADQVRVVFVNDLYDPEAGIDRNLQVDRIVVNGQTVETESDSVFSTGTWKAEDGIQPGFRNSEYLHGNGYFQFDKNDGGNGGGGGLADVAARTEFGVANDIEDLGDPSLGFALRRVTEASYPGDGSGAQWAAPEPASLPNTPPNFPQNVGTAVQPLKITDNIYAPGSDENRPNSGGLNEYSQFFAQFVTHDMVHSIRAAGPPIFLDGQFVPVSRTPGIIENGVVQQVSTDTPSLDLGLVYGKDELATYTLRELATENGEQVAGAKLISGGAGDVLPSYAEVAAYRGLPVDEVQSVLGKTFLNLPPEGSVSQAATGDERANQTTSITVHHTIWFRNHNWHVDQLRAQNPDWSEEQLYQAARALNEAEYQKVVYDEYLPKLMGEYALSEYSGYKADVDPAIINEWTTVAFRFGHDQASAGQVLIAEDGTISFVPLEFSSLIANSGQNIKTDEALGDWTRGQLFQSSQEIDGRIVSTLRNALFGVPADQDGNDGSADEFLQLNLPLLDIHRGRDHGVSDYNKLRAGLGLSTYHSIEDFAQENGLSEERYQQLKSVYNDISELDSIVGGLLEAKLPGSQLGETFTILNVMQFESTRDGDPYFYLNRFKDSPEVLEQISQSSMSEILVRVGAVDQVGPDPFTAQGPPVGSTVQIAARGDTGSEILILEVKGERVFRWQVDTDFNVFTFKAEGPVAPSDIRIVYENDGLEADGADRNLQVDKIAIDGQIIEMESDAVYSTGTWKAEDGIVPGFRNSEYLHAYGYFEIRI